MILKKLMIFIILCLLPLSISAKEYTIGFAQDTLKNDWRLAQIEELKDEAKKHPNLKLIIKSANAKVSKQIRDIEIFIEQEVDFIITSPIEANITSLALKKAIDKGIKVILLSRTVNSDNYTTFISPDNEKIGEEAAKHLVDTLDKKGVILELQGIKTATSTIKRSAGFNKIIKQYPNIKVIRKNANFLRANAITVMQELYKKDIKFDAIFSHSDSMLEGVRKVMRKYKKDLTIPMIGIDYIKASQSAILSGEQSATFVYQTSAKEGVQAIVDIINNKAVKKNITLDTLKVTKDNVSKIQPIF
ncbi:substrate-binding domain-containing protein [Arcobacter roscoffensis]|uniref:Substrate-binding domain-containing protein n=1 Tax=Arcobacter roscoffensis TaxID=2961520 RepID=A0ABY5DZG9_9BACT|nr:substrate-binding domain-containing protein [Arcobacter roscoffensis]UTJ05354.1 substrate-binding domain-containing protein [Arcobacter roscoffensis]